MCGVVLHSKEVFRVCCFPKEFWLCTFRMCEADSKCLSILCFLKWSMTILHVEQNNRPSSACSVPFGYFLTLFAAVTFTAVWLSFFAKNFSIFWPVTATKSPCDVALRCRRSLRHKWPAWQPVKVFKWLLNDQQSDIFDIFDHMSIKKRSSLHFKRIDIEYTTRNKEQHVQLKSIVNQWPSEVFNHVMQISRHKQASRLPEISRKSPWCHEYPTIDIY